MNAEFGMNWIPLAVLLPLTLIVAIGIGWLIAKLKIEKWKRITFGVVGVFAVFGFAVAIVTVYYNMSWQFANTFNYYAYSALAPGNDPFVETENEAEPVLMIRDVWTGDRVGEFANVPNPDFASIVYLFVPGKYITANYFQDEKLTIPEIPAGSMPAVTETSLWWALSKNIHKLNYTVKSE
jgi:hypothetical protein